MEFSKFDQLSAKIWGNFLKITSGFEKNKILGLIRSVSLPITLFSVIIAGLLAWSFGSFDPILFAVNMIGLLLAHASSNVINDWWDYKNKVDTPEYFRLVYGVHPVFSIGERKSFLLGLFLSFLAFLCGLFLASKRGPAVILLAIVGFVLLFSYSGKPLKLKYRGLGEFLVFLIWGPMMIAGSFFVISGYIDEKVIVASFPYGISASLIVFGKHLDKLEEDSKKGVKTLPVILGERKTKILCKVLIFAMYISVILTALLTQRLGFLFSFLSLPRAIKVFRGIDYDRPKDLNEVPDFYPKDFWPMWYVGGAFILNTDFALSFILGTFLARFF
jgi:1,4-dihydroxy-2-naphthoate octaprenyltransferase